MGHVQDTPVLTKIILNECMMYHMKVHIFSYNFGPKIFSKSKICILPNYEQTDSKTAIVHAWSKFFMVPSKLKAMTIYVVKQACRHDIMA